MTAKDAPLQVPRLSWMVGGAQGSGVDTAATTFGRACAHAGLEVLGKREFYSNIKGRHSYYHVMVSPRKILSHEENAHILVGLDARSEEHTSELQSRRDLVCRLLLEKKKE